MAFHCKDGWYFERLEMGVVRIYHKDEGGVIDKVVKIDADAWASVIAYVSARGENAETFKEAGEFHNGR